MSRRKKTPETPLSAELRKFAAGYTATGQHERAQGYLGAADFLDDAAARWITLPGDVTSVVSAGAPGPAEIDTLPEAAFRRRVLDRLDQLTARVGALESRAPAATTSSTSTAERSSNGACAPAGARAVDEPARPDAVTLCARTLLTVLCDFAPAPLSRGELAIRARYSVESGGFAGALSELRAAHWVGGPAEALYATAGGRAHALAAPLPIAPDGGPDLLEYWVTRVGRCAGTILQVLATAYPNELARAELAERSGYQATSGGFAGALSRLRRLGLVHEGRASEALMRAVCNARS